MTMRARPAADAVAQDDDGPERIYVLTGGRGGPSGSTRLDLVTLVVAVGRRGPAGQPEPPPKWSQGGFPEHLAILRLCRRPLSVAELSAHVRLPFSATAVLIDDLLGAGLVSTRAAVHAVLPDREVIEEVLRGLQRL
jgi:hypothetical protein